MTMYRAPSQNRPPVHALRLLPPGTVYLGEDQTYWYFAHPGANPALNGFFDNIGNMFSRMVKFTPKSFTPGNIYKGVVNTALTAATGGLYQVLPKHIKKSVYEIGKVAVPVVAGAVVAYTAGPAVMNVLAPKLQAAGSLLGKAASTIGGRLFEFMGKLGPSQQANVAGSITPEQIVAMEQSEQLPPALAPYFAQQAAQSWPEPSSGAAALYDPGAMAQLELERKEKAQAGSFDPTLLLLIGAPVAVFAVMSASGRK